MRRKERKMIIEEIKELTNVYSEMIKSLSEGLFTKTDDHPKKESKRLTVKMLSSIKTAIDGLLLRLMKN